MFKKILNKFIIFFILIAIGFSLLYGSESAIEHIVPNQSYTQHTSQDLAEAGGTADIYYLDDGKVAKILNFSENKKNRLRFEQERKVFSLTRDLQLPLVKCHEGTSVTIDGIEYGALIMDRAEGQSLNALMKEYTQASFSKKKKWNLLKEAIQQTAISLKMLHKAPIKIESEDSLPSDRNILRRFLHINDHDKLAFSAKEIVSKYHELQAKSFPTLGLCHNDLHPGNIFFDAKTNKITFIDVATMQTADTTNDVAYFLLFFEALSKTLSLSQSDVDTLKEVFLKAYFIDPLELNDALQYQDMVISMDMLSYFDDEPKIQQWLIKHMQQILAA